MWPTKRKEGDLAGALSDYFAAVAINQRLGNEDWLGKNYDNIGTIYLRLGDHPKALDHMLKARAPRTDRRRARHRHLVQQPGLILPATVRPERGLALHPGSL
ncbi:MAG: tetratricopeptide repeat protein [Flavobacteriales bacterium]|nr:tetratricopeptide repeat protein [Flavobacteriales bacterium]